MLWQCWLPYESLSLCPQLSSLAQRGVQLAEKGDQRQLWRECRGKGCRPLNLKVWIKVRGGGVIGWGELIQWRSKIKAISGVVGCGIGPQLMGGICLGVTMQGKQKERGDPLVLPGLMGIQLCCNWPIPPQAPQQCTASYFPIHNYSSAPVTHRVGGPRPPAYHQVPSQTTSLMTT